MIQTQPPGFLSFPDGGNGPGVLVLHAWWGLNETTRAFCRRLSEAGFTVFAPDLYHGEVADDIAGAEALLEALNANEERARSDIAAATRLLKEYSSQNGGGLAVIGFSLGAYYALELSNDDPENYRSVVLFYGNGPDDFSRSEAAYLGHFGEQDDYEPLEGVAALEASLKAAGRPVTFYRYPEAGHWFFEADRPQAYIPAAADLAWQRTLDFLRNGAA